MGGSESEAALIGKVAVTKLDLLVPHGKIRLSRTWPCACHTFESTLRYSIMRKINLSRFEGNLRVVAGAIALAVGSHGMWYLVPFAIGLMATGLAWY